ncbi:MAG TPA: hypothetical protein VG992_02810 [Candidatus Saccharimonadales bacterium]|nr:hypothetical protein [Candidatus Saccharimonadales bacterium]
MKRVGRFRLLIASSGVLLLLSGLAPAGASSANISHSYQADGHITNGSLVSLDPTQTDAVQAANTKNGERLLGVAVATNDSLLAVDPNAGNIQIATNGTVNTLVSNVNGDIKVGDQISVSPFNGVGMKAAPGAHVIGLAQTAFDSSTVGSTSETVTDVQGKQHQIIVGYVRLSIAVGTATNASASLNNLQRLAKALTGHTVSTARIIVALIVALVGLTALITLTYASIYGSIISIGRNPLAKFAIFRTLGSVLTVASLTAVIAGFTIFLLLH